MSLPTPPVAQSPTCTFHADRTTYRSCSRCGEPYCHDCLVDGPVGSQCLTCVAEGRGYNQRIDPDREATFGELVKKVRPSPIFLGVVAAFAASGVWAWTAGSDVNNRWPIRALVITGWVLSLCLHEFGHASVAFLGGDRSVASKGYLTLDPRKYANSMMSVGLPLLFLLMGGIGLPGGAVYIQTGRIRSLKMRSLMSLAGPAANILCGLIFGLPFLLGMTSRGHGVFYAGLAFLAMLQMFAALLNLLPIPGLDGFGAIQPFLSRSAQQAAMQASRFSFIILFLVVFQVPAVGHALWTGAEAMSGIVRVPRLLAVAGQSLFSFD